MSGGVHKNSRELRAPTNFKPHTVWRGDAAYRVRQGVIAARAARSAFRWRFTRFVTWFMGLHVLVQRPTSAIQLRLTKHIPMKRQSKPPPKRGTIRKAKRGVRVTLRKLFVNRWFWETVLRTASLIARVIEMFDRR